MQKLRSACMHQFSQMFFSCVHNNVNFFIQVNTSNDSVHSSTGCHDGQLDTPNVKDTRELTSFGFSAIRVLPEGMLLYS